jgi:tRNA A58 N-methylase Trm61
LNQYAFGLAETVEVLRRTWHIEKRSVRPDHRMVAHTGFLTTARRLVRQLDEPIVASDESENDE